jgi:hypothetical protein
MKRECIFVILSLFCTGGIGMAMDTSTEGGVVDSTNKYHLAYVDVKDAAHNYEVGEEPGNDETYVRGEIRQQLEGLQIESTFGNNPNADLHVMCRFKHTLMMPVITMGFQLKMTSIGKCTIQVVDKKAEKVLIEKSWVRGKKNGKLPDFIKTVFEEFKGELETNAVPQVPAGSAPKITNSVPSPSASTESVTNKSKGDTH